MNKKFLVTGCAGFIGSHAVDRLLAQGHVVIGIDNFSTGMREFLVDAQDNKNFRLIEADLLDAQLLKKEFFGVDCVFHFAANADVRHGLNQPDRDLYQNTMVTFHVLEAMRHCKVRNIIFSSTGSVYGECKVIPTPEDGPFPIQTSLYGASKLACEGLIAAYCEGYGFQSHIFRFVSILGERYTHGHVYDFYRKLKEDPKVLNVLGNGRQTKSYLYVHDCLDAIFMAMEKSEEKVNIFNLGYDGCCEVRDSVGWICHKLGLNPQVIYTDEVRGWVGDNPIIYLDTRKICQLGWQPQYTIQEAIGLTVAYLQNHEWVYERRA